MKKNQNEALELFTKKILIQIEDKLHRSMSITKNGVNLINDEGIRDRLIDLHNYYYYMALMLLDE